MQSSVDRTLLALADPTRRGVVDLLRQKPRRATEIAEALSMSPPAMSRHLRVLRQTGLVTNDELEGDARVRVYRLEQQPFVELRSWLDHVEAFWTTQLGAFKAHAERRVAPARAVHNAETGRVPEPRARSPRRSKAPASARSRPAPGRDRS